MPEYDKDRFHLFNMLIELPLLDEVDKYRAVMPREGNKYPTRADAIRVLLRIGLDSSPRPEQDQK